MKYNNLNVYQKMLLVAIVNMPESSIKQLSQYAGCCYKKAHDTLKELETQGIIRKLGLLSDAKKGYELVNKAKVKGLSSPLYYRILQLQGIKCHEKYTLMLISLSNEISYNKLATRLECTKKTAIRLISDLVDKQLILKKVNRLTRNFNCTNTYTINFDYQDSEMVQDQARDEEKISAGQGGVNPTYSEDDTYVSSKQYKGVTYIESLMKYIEETFERLLEKMNRVFKHQSFNLSSNKDVTSNKCESHTQGSGEGGIHFDNNVTKKNKPMSRTHQLNDLENRVKGFNYMQDEEAAVIEAIDYLYYSNNVMNHDNTIIRKNMENINGDIVDAALYKFRQQAEKQHIKNTIKYFATCLYQTIISYKTNGLFINSKINSIEKYGSLMEGTI